MNLPGASTARDLRQRPSAICRRSWRLRLLAENLGQPFFDAERFKAEQALRAGFFDDHIVTDLREGAIEGRDVGRCGTQKWLKLALKVVRRLGQELYGPSKVRREGAGQVDTLQARQVAHPHDARNALVGQQSLRQLGDVQMGAPGHR